MMGLLHFIIILIRARFSRIGKILFKLGFQILRWDRESKNYEAYIFD